MVQEPGSIYLKHIIPKNGSGAALADELVDAIRFYESNDVIKVLGSDGCPTNTGQESGAIHLCEIALWQPLDWAICLLHCNELLFGNFFIHLDGGTVGNVGFKGSLGKTLVSLERDGIVMPFSPVAGKVEKLQDDVILTLSSDQWHLYEACCSLMSGSPPPTSYFGNYHHARWLTLCNCALRLYVISLNPTNKLKKLVSFVTNVYAPMWFSIKKSTNVADGARLFFKAMVLVSSCPQLTKSRPGLLCQNTTK